MSLDIMLYKEEKCVADFNITHNLNTMADKAGIYEALWRPEEIGALEASDIIGYLSDGLDKMRIEPEYFKLFEASNGWGKYVDFVLFVERVLNACIKYPDATIQVYR